MPNLRSYEREQLLALPAGAELDELVHEIILGPMEDKLGVIQAIFPRGYYSRQNKDVGGVLQELRAHWPRYEINSNSDGFKVVDDWQKEPEDRQLVTASGLPHVCALALVLAAWEKERQP